LQKSPSISQQDIANIFLSFLKITKFSIGFHLCPLVHPIVVPRRETADSIFLLSHVTALCALSTQFWREIKLCSDNHQFSSRGFTAFLN
jgi:hypothetical protein